MAGRSARAGRRPSGRSGVLHDLRRLAGSTFSICMRHRVTGLAAEIGFFALLSLPPLVLGLVGTLGYFADVIGTETVEEVRNQILELSRKALSDETVADVIEPTLRDVLDGGRFEIVSFGFLLSLWSGSRALNVIIDTITIMYGLGGKRGIIATRALSFSLYIVALVIGIVLVPLVLAGPSLVSKSVPEGIGWLNALYWPVVVVLTVASLTTLFWISVPVPNSWWRGAPGAVLALVGWIGGSYFLRVIIDWSVGGTSIYGPLAAPIVVLIWLYALAIMMLIGAAFNAAVDRRWPQRLDQHTLDGQPVAPPTVRAAKPEDTATVVPLLFGESVSPDPAPTEPASESPVGKSPVGKSPVGKSPAGKSPAGESEEVKRHGRR